MHHLPASSLQRLHTQPDTLLQLLDEADAAVLARRPASGKWSILENLAHLGRYQEVFLTRLETLLAQDTPAFPRYAADQDPEFARWAALSFEDVRNAFRQSRQPLVQRLTALAPAQYARTATHPVYGRLHVVGWTEFFLLHEAHHLFTMLRLLPEVAAEAAQQQA